MYNLIYSGHRRGCFYIKVLSSPMLRVGCPLDLTVLYSFYLGICYGPTNLNPEKSFHNRRARTLRNRDDPPLKNARLWRPSSSFISGNSHFTLLAWCQFSQFSQFSLSTYHLIVDLTRTMGGV